MNFMSYFKNKFNKTNTNKNTTNDITTYIEKEDEFIRNISKDWFYLKGDNFKDCDLYYYPQTESEMKIMFKEDVLNENITNYILKYYPDINNLTIKISNMRGCRGTIRVHNNIYVCIYISYINGPNECLLKISDILYKHFENLDIPKKYYDYNYTVNRHYSNDVLLNACRKYADCICKNLEININNIQCLKVGSVSLYDLAILDLNSIDMIENIQVG